MKRAIALALALCLLLSFSSLLIAKPRKTIPRLQPVTFEPLQSRVDSRLQRQLDKELAANPQWAKLVRERKMAVGLVDLADPNGPRFAAINGDRMMYAASLPKIAILLAGFAAFEDGSLKETKEIYEDLHAMIRVSSNTAATRMIDRLGFQKIEQVLTDPRFKFFDPAHGGGLWVGKRYAKSGARHPDPLQGLSHAATANQVCRFYYMLAAGKILNPRRSAQMLEILADPGLHHKFVGVIEKRDPEARLFRKSGTWKQWHSDSVLVWGGEERRYILVGLVENEQGEQILRDLVPTVENLVVVAAKKPLTRTARAH